MLLTFIFPNIVSFPKNVEKSNQPVLFYENWSRFLFYLKFYFLKHKMRSLCNSICSAKKQISQCIFTLNLKWKNISQFYNTFPTFDKCASIFHILRRKCRVTSQFELINAHLFFAASVCFFIVLSFDASIYQPQFSRIFDAKYENIDANTHQMASLC